MGRLGFSCLGESTPDFICEIIDRVSLSIETTIGPEISSGKMQQQQNRPNPTGNAMLHQAFQMKGRAPPPQGLGAVASQQNHTSGAGLRQQLGMTSSVSGATLIGSTATGSAIDGLKKTAADQHHVELNQKWDRQNSDIEDLQKVLDQIISLKSKLEENLEDANSKLDQAEDDIKKSEELVRGKEQEAVELRTQFQILEGDLLQSKTVAAALQDQISQMEDKINAMETESVSQQDQHGSEKSQ
eukprot:gene7463-604_t